MSSGFTYLIIIITIHSMNRNCYVSLLVMIQLYDYLVEMLDSCQNIAFTAAIYILQNDRNCTIDHPYKVQP